MTILGFPKHLLFYRFDENEVFVRRVVHGARDLERLYLLNPKRDAMISCPMPPLPRSLQQR
jgi:hypothetical protein